MMKLTKGKIKLIKALELKKYRKKYQLFVVEGIKNINELLSSDFEIEEIIATNETIKKLKLPENPNFEITITQDSDFEKISFQKTPQKVLAIAKIKNWQISPNLLKDKLMLGLDNIQDPGNLGTIMRAADWFGIDGIVCSKDCVDVYNPKVVQASMGAIFRVPITYTDLKEFIIKAKNNSTIYGTFMNGQNIFKTKLNQNGLIVLGNEAHGIRPEIQKIIDVKLSIPSFNPKPHVESLNVAMAASIIIAEFKRRTL